MTAGKRAFRKALVRDWLLAYGPADLMDISYGTALTPAAVSKALVDIRNDPALEYATVATKSSAWCYQIAETVPEMLAGLRNQVKHLDTRSESLIMAGEKATAIAATPDEYALAADLKATGRILKMQAEAIGQALN